MASGGGGRPVSGSWALCRARSRLTSGGRPSPRAGRNERAGRNKAGREVVVQGGGAPKGLERVDFRGTGAGRSFIGPLPCRCRR
ncbi:hypothetical protein Sdia_12830 [Streptomyces diastaticus subsp. diastaticus]|uniref:Uncharacterized protein n=1 Tax=Streptomyces diastaticus subsp. diastaticus TaxID=68040 RepID=A0ABQ1CJT8_STRDI|nr:hypothetical protein Srut_14510 [Streptomyces rutgersensis]GFH70515.1 hypothetical protein Sdia_12830 [Streptomyces diastaticus subsp. diastaticus]GGU35186.1 hypothetical protein GCM10015534_42340 [Streptomyces diastaticus subsp. diastaticus]